MLYLFILLVWSWGVLVVKLSGFKSLGKKFLDGPRCLFDVWTSVSKVSSCFFVTSSSAGCFLYVEGPIPRRYGHRR